MLVREGAAKSTLADRLFFAKEAFAVSSGYDSAIFNYFDSLSEHPSALRVAVDGEKTMRYGENPHQKGFFFGEFDKLFEQLHGKEISYNNLLDIDAAVSLMAEFSEPTFAILKHNNACGVASRSNILDAWKDALAGDPVSAFGGVLIANREIDAATAEEINKIFFEVVIAPAYTADALAILEQKKNRIILLQKQTLETTVQFRSILNGALVQERDLKVETRDDLRQVTVKAVNPEQIDDLLFANKLVKHCKSNAIVLAKNRQLCAAGVGQTSRVDSLRQAIDKAHTFGFDLSGAVMASDAFFPFADCVEIAHKAGIDAVIQPGGSIRDNDSIKYCDENSVAMVMTGFRHFKH
jgi:phosphoribosylaminoimidazolecarboxamide formyltransferase/IMP cyclohydrolase